MASCLCSNNQMPLEAQTGGNSYTNLGIALLNLMPFSHFSLAFTVQRVHHQKEGSVSDAGDAGTETIAQRVRVEMFHGQILLCKTPDKSLLRSVTHPTPPPRPSASE